MRNEGKGEGLTTKTTKGAKAQRHKGTKAHKILTNLVLFARANPEGFLTTDGHGFARIEKIATKGIKNTKFLDPLHPHKS